MNGQKTTDYIAVTYDQNRTPKTEYPALLADYLSRRFGIKPGSTLLDVGCGRGDMIKAFAGIGMTCSAVDKVCSSVQESAVCAISQVDIEKETFPFPDDHFDVVFSKSVIEHMWDPFCLMAELRRILKPGGLCLILTPDWVSQMDVFYEDPTHCRPYVPDTLKDLMTMTGFGGGGSELFCQHQLIWQSSTYRSLAAMLRLFLKTRHARRLTQKTGVKFFRWAVEMMVLGWGYK